MACKKLKIALILIGIICCSSGFVSGETIDFEDLYAPGGQDVSAKRLADGYHGFNWSGNIWAINKDSYPGTHWENGILEYAGIYGGSAYGTYPVVLNTQLPGYFNFTSAYITSVWAGINDVPSSYNVSVEGWKNGIKIDEYDKSVTVTNTLTEFVFDYSGIDTLWFRPELANGSQIIIDDIRYNRTISTPEPSSIMLLGFGIFLFSCSMIGKRKKTYTNQ